MEEIAMAGMGSADGVLCEPVCQVLGLDLQDVLHPAGEPLLLLFVPWEEQEDRLAAPACDVTWLQATVQLVEPVVQRGRAPPGWQPAGTPPLRHRQSEGEDLSIAPRCSHLCFSFLPTLAADLPFVVRPRPAAFEGWRDDTHAWARLPELSIMTGSS